MYKISLILAILTMVFSSGCSLSTSNSLELNEVHMNKLVHGLTEDEMSLENAIEKYSDHVVLGTINAFEKLNNSRDIYKVTITDSVLGGTPEEILVYTTEKDILEMDKEYLLFIKDFSSNVYDKDFFVLNEEFVIKVEEDGTLSRLEDVFKKTYVPPFVEEKFNNYGELKKHIQSNYKKEKTNKKQSVDKLSDHELVDKADHILSITVSEVTPEQNGLAIVGYKINKAYKNGNLENVHSLLLPNTLEVGKEYLIFLNNREEDPGAVTITSREGSIIEKDTNEYKKIIKLLN
ncbi:hypothetical protein ACFSCX_06915 [Bacillus salitolerans]|uniref:Lipoprotein n=1 Tax=Bacillus salitolerans TaxID=1437434 RepID=A0ABW4LN15_9BACI